MSNLYGARPASASARPSSSGPPPRFEFGSTMLHRPEQFVSMTLRTQPQAYPHQSTNAASSSAAAAVAGPRPPAARPASARPSSACSYASTPRAHSSSSGRPASHSVQRPASEDDAVRDRYLPSRTRSAYVATAPPLALPHTYAHDTDYEAHLSHAAAAAAATAASSSVATVAAAASSASVPSSARSTRSTYSAPIDPTPRTRPGSKHPAAPREFMATPAYFVFLANREANDSNELTARLQNGEHSSRPSSSSSKRNSAPAASYTPTIPFPARFASSASSASSSSSSHVAAGSSIPASATLRLPTALGLHERSLDVLVVLADLKAQLDACFEVVRIDEKERRQREQAMAQANFKAKQQAEAEAQAAANAQHFIRTGNHEFSVPNTPNVTSTTLALLAHTPALSSSSKRSAAESPQQPPTFLTDAEMESHALSNLTPAQRRSIFGGRQGPNEEKEAPFDRANLSTHPDAPSSAASNNKHRGSSSLRSKPAPPTTALPDQIEYTPEMCLAFEQSVRHWGEFLLQSASTAPVPPQPQPHLASNKSGPSPPAPPTPVATPNADLILVLADASAKYASLVRLAMTPTPVPSPSDGSSAMQQTHHLLPRMMEAVWKLVMVVLETALVRKAAAGPARMPSASPSSSSPAAATLEASTVTNNPAHSPYASPTNHSVVELMNRTAVTLALRDSSDSSIVAVPTSAPAASASSSPSSSFDPTNPSDLAELETNLRHYSTHMVLRESGGDVGGGGVATSSALSAAQDVLSALELQRAQGPMREAGLYSVGLVLQRDSLLKSSERLMRENELLKLRLRTTEASLASFTEEGGQNTLLRSLAEGGQDSVGLALDELDEWMEDALDARKGHMATLVSLADLATEYSAKHLGAVSAQSSAESSHQEALDTLARLQAKETNIEAARQNELEERAAAELAAATAQAKSHSVLDREVGSLDILSAEEIAAKVANVSDVDTLRAMLVKLLSSRGMARRGAGSGTGSGSRAETPTQRAARMRKESTPKMLREVMVRATVGAQADKIVPLKLVMKQILEIYFCKIVADDAQAKDGGLTTTLTRTAGGGRGGGSGSGQALHVFVSEWLSQRFGLRSLSDAAFGDLLKSVLVYLYPDRPSHRRYAASVAPHTGDMLDRAVKPRLNTFARALHLFTDEPLPAPALDFFLYALKVLQEAAAQSIPGSFGTSHPLPVAAGALSESSGKNMLRLLELACVPMHPPHPPPSSSSARSSKRASLTDSSSIFAVTTTTVGGGALLSAVDDGSIGLFVPLFLGVEALSHAFRHLGYGDEAMDELLVLLERDLVYPLSLSVASTSKSQQAPMPPSSPSSAADRPAKLRMLFKQVLVRQMMRSGGMALMGGAASSNNLSIVWDRFDSDRTGVVTFAKLRAGLVALHGQSYGPSAAPLLDEDSFAQLESMMSPSGRGLLGVSGGLIFADLTSALSPEYRLALPLDSALQDATAAWVSEHEALTASYRRAFSEADPTAHGIINFAEFWTMIQKLTSAQTPTTTSTAEPSASVSAESAPLSSSSPTLASAADATATMAGSTSATSRCTRPFAAKMFREGVEHERRALQEAREAEAAAMTKADAKSKKKKKRASNEASTNAAGGKKSSVATAPPPAAADKHVQFSLPTDASTSSATAAPAPLPPRPIALGAADFISLDTCLSLLRRHRIGLPPRRPYHEFKSFLRRYKNESSTPMMFMHSTQSAHSTPVAATTTTPTTSATTKQPSATPATSSPLMADSIQPAEMAITTIQE